MRLFWTGLFICFFVGLLAFFVVFIDDQPQSRSKLITYTAEAGQSLRKFEWDGHLWISLNSDSIAHHPDCTCLKKEFEAQEVTPVHGM